MSKNDFLALTQLEDCFASLPGIGRKSAGRLAYHVLKMPDEKAELFAKSITQAKKTFTTAKNAAISPIKKFAIYVKTRRAMAIQSA